MLETRDISFSYNNSETVLRGVSFVASPGEVISIVGANGAGKTTLIKLLATLLIPDRGTLMLEGRDVFTRPLSYRRQLGYVPEKVALYEDMSVKNYLEYRAKFKGEQTKRIRRRVGEACDLCRLKGIEAKRIATLSLGLKKRVALADALLLRPRVLLLDDFLSGLDFEMKGLMGTILAEAAAFSSVITTGHELESYAAWTTRFLVLKNGVISSTIGCAGMTKDVLMQKIESSLHEKE